MSVRPFTVSVSAVAHGASKMARPWAVKQHHVMLSNKWLASVCLDCPSPRPLQLRTLIAINQATTGMMCSVMRTRLHSKYQIKCWMQGVGVNALE